MTTVKPQDELQCVIETDALLLDPAMARRLLELVRKFPMWRPDRYGSHEPLTRRFSHATTPDELVTAWAGGSESRRLRTLLLSKRRLYAGTLLSWGDQSRLDSVHFSCQRPKLAPAAIADCLAVAHATFDAVSGQYGYFCLREEYRAKNVVDAWIGESGRSEGGRALGTNRRQHLPGLYWANFFGPHYEGFFGKARLAATPAFSVQRGERSWVLLSAAHPNQWNTPDAVSTVAVMRQHLGADAFFDADAPDAPTRTPAELQRRHDEP